MKKLLVWFLILSATSAISYLAFSYLNFTGSDNSQAQKTQKAILKVALVSDSENENDMLEKALSQAKEKGANFVIGLGDFTSLGEKQDLEKVKNVFDASGLTYYLTPGDRDLWDSRNKYGALTEETGEQSIELSYGEAQNRGLISFGPLENYLSVFGKPDVVFTEKGIRFIIVNNSDLYYGIDAQGWNLLEQAFGKVTKETKEPDVKTFGSSGSSAASGPPKLTFVFAHQTPYHPDSKHVMGREDEKVAKQAKEFMELLEGKRDPTSLAKGELRGASGFFSGDMHFFAKFNSPDSSVRITTIGAASSKRNFQGPRYAILTVYEDNTWEVEDVEIR